MLLFLKLYNLRVRQFIWKSYIFELHLYFFIFYTITSRSYICQSFYINFLVNLSIKKDKFANQSLVKSFLASNNKISIFLKSFI